MCDWHVTTVHVQSEKDSVIRAEAVWLKPDMDRKGQHGAMSNRVSSEQINVTASEMCPSVENLWHYGTGSTLRMMFFPHKINAVFKNIYNLLFLSNVFWLKMIFFSPIKCLFTRIRVNIWGGQSTATADIVQLCIFMRKIIESLEDSRTPPMTPSTVKQGCIPQLLPSTGQESKCT